MTCGAVSIFLLGSGFPPGSDGRASAQDAYTSPERDFSIAFPAAPEVKAQPPETSDTAGAWTYLAKADGHTFVVTVDQYPASIQPPQSTPHMYLLLLQGHAVESSSQLLSTAPAELDGLPAVQGVFSRPDGGRELRRVTMVGRRIYQVSYSYAGGAGGPEQGEAFIGSFKLHNR